MKLNKSEIFITVLISVVILGTYVVSTTLAEQSGGSPESGEDSVLMDTYNSLKSLGYGTETGANGPVWNRIISSANWVPDGTVTEDTVISGYTFYDESRTAKTGILDYPNYEVQSLQAKDFRDSNASDSWSSWTKTNTSPEVWQDGRTGLYWSASQGSMTNEFTIGLCDFFSTTPRGSYGGSDTDCGNAINACATLSLDADGDTVAESNWYLPTQAELMQAYLNGIYLGTNTSWATGSLFWSSTEASSTSAWGTNLYSGNTNGSNKTSSYSVRCVLRDL
ncbi:MAG: hypothetical protein XD93_0054 [candidate division WS6 bacterium 34_10]|uniref:Lcl C-terminal domain-containing protein n=1 Tax=candidate division WS6 bacterium 34_10 TaxID=1641389 RepID=A0A101HJ60_9BACT|nr:MAG: hypothetical protein XD93_0054 [candidate division WS6 bacterium 34_10]